ncbi:MAG: GyrI-like domain-containing protein [bacterium]
MKRINYKKDFKQFFAPSAKVPALVEVPAFRFLMVEGHGAPGGTAFQEAIQAVYSAHFTIKFTLKFSNIGPEYTLPPLEALWWAKSGNYLDVKKPSDWQWRVMLMQPPHVTKKHLADAITQIREKATKKAGKKGARPASPALATIQLAPFTEGLCVQIMHIGPYAQEKPTIECMQQFAKAKGYEMVGKHHEIYLGDPRMTQPEKLRTVLRHPLRRAAA